MREPHFPLSNLAGSSSSSQYAVPKDTPTQKEAARVEEQLSLSAVAKAANLMLNITKDMVRTTYKKIIRNVYKRKLQHSKPNHNVIAETGQIANLKDKQSESE